MPVIGIIGYGKFGQLLHKLLIADQSKFNVLYWDQDSKLSSSSFSEILKADIIIPAVPIAALKNITANLLGKLAKEQLVIDVSSVKLYSKEILSELSQQTQVILSHPMFGPGTLLKKPAIQLDALNGLNINLENLSADKNVYANLKDVLSKTGLLVHELTAEQHDRLTAQFQFTSLLLALTLKDLNLNSNEFSNTPIATESFKALQAFMNMITVDRELLKNIYQYNPYCKNQLADLESKLAQLKFFIQE